MIDSLTGNPICRLNPKHQRARITQVAFDWVISPVDLRRLRCRAASTVKRGSNLVSARERSDVRAMYGSAMPCDRPQLPVLESRSRNRSPRPVSSQWGWAPVNSMKCRIVGAGMVQPLS